MRRVITKAFLKEFFRREQFEPETSRALLITLALIAPLFIAYTLGKPLLGIFPALTAQLLTSAKIEGSYLEKTLILLLGTCLCIIAGFAGIMSGNHLWSSLLFLGIVALFASMARGIVDYGQVFGVSCVILFLISLYPPNTLSNAFHHSILIAFGGLWAITINIIQGIFLRNPFYIAIAKPWYYSTQLMKSLSNPDWIRKNENWISETEIELRKAINGILPWIRRKRSQTANVRLETLKLVRASSRLGATSITLYNELQFIQSINLPISILLKVKKASSSVAASAETITDVLSNGIKGEFRKVVNHHVNKATISVTNLSIAVENENLSSEDWVRLLHIISLFESAIQYQQDAIKMLIRIAQSPRKKELIGSSNIKLRAQELFKKTILQFQTHSLLFKHSLRVMTVTCIGLTIYYSLNIPRGYWIVLTIMILLQPEFGNTWNKAMDRITGTLLGSLVGSLMLFMAPSMHIIIPISAIAVSCFLFSFYQNKNYKVAVVFVTIMLVMMLDITEHIDWHIGAYRILYTLIGGILAIGGSYLLWPDWESRQLPVRIAKAIERNKNYLLQIKSEIEARSGFHPRVIADRRKAEIENINLDESLKSARIEPNRFRRKMKNAEQIAEQNKKLTKALTSFASFLPELKGYEDLPEAREMIEVATISLEKLSAGLQKGESKKLRNELEMTTLVMEARIELLKDTRGSYQGGAIIMDTSFYPYQILVSELRKIIEIIKALIDLNEEETEINNG